MHGVRVIDVAVDGAEPVGEYDERGSEEPIADNILVLFGD